MKKISFNQVPVKSAFSFDGTLWYKQSTRTACVYGMPHRWFYFSKKDLVQYNKPY